MWKDKVRTVRDFIIKHGKVTFPVIVIAAVAVTATIAMNAGDSKEDAIINTISSGDAEEVTLDQPAEEVPLVQNEDGAIYTLIATYYNALALGDEETLNSICDEISDQDMLRYVETSKYIESYPALEIYTKQGPEEEVPLPMSITRWYLPTMRSRFPDIRPIISALMKTGNCISSEVKTVRAFMIISRR